MKLPLDETLLIWTAVICLLVALLTVVSRVKKVWMC